MTEKELKEVSDKLKSDAEKLFKQHDSELQSVLNGKIDEAVEKLQKGMITKEQMDAALKTATDEYSQKATSLEEALRKQGDIINGLKEEIKTPVKKGATMKTILAPLVSRIKEMRDQGQGFITIDLIRDGVVVDGKKTVTSIGNSVSPMDAPPTSPYAPGIGPEALSLFDIVRNPLFVSNYTDVGETNQSRIAWINETGLTGLPTLVTEGSQKPNSYRTFKVEFSAAKKIADYIQITEEFDQDLGYLSDAAQSLLQLDVARAWDLQIQADVINKATQLSFTTQLGPNNVTIAPYKNAIFDATLWDGLFAMGTAVRLANFMPNVSLLNPLTYGKLVMTKDAYGRYNTPPDDIIKQVNPIQGNNVSADWSLVGDLKQFKVKIYEDFRLKVGWINDDLIRNQFTIVAEVRFHDFISAARQQAIMYANCKWLAEQMNGGSNFPIGS